MKITLSRDHRKILETTVAQAHVATEADTEYWSGLFSRFKQ